MRKILFSLPALVVLLAACARMVPAPLEPSSGHIQDNQETPQKDIPELVQQTPVLPEPEEPAEVEKYTVVVNEVPVKELLFALARDANINVDISPRISGEVTVNAVDQTMNQILDRIARQIDLRYDYQDEVLVIQPDEPFLRSYQVNYISQSRQMTGNVELNTSIGSSGGGSSGGGGGSSGSSGGGGGGTGSTNVTIEASNDFWSSLVESVKNIIGEDAKNSDVSAYPETGMLLVRATANKQRQVQELIDSAVQSARRQVLIQVTIAEVNLSNDYQAGIDWSVLGQGGEVGFSINSTALPTAGTVGEFSNLILDFSYDDPDASTPNELVNAQVRLLEEFGDVSILSSPQIIALNNQTAILKVVDDIVYFEVDAETSQSQTNTVTTFDTTPKTVSVGVSMSVTPQINDNDSVILNVRPSISRILRFVQDPNPQLTVSSGVPELRVREMETLLRVNSGQIAVLGGLMENREERSDAATPGFSKLPGLGELFKSRSKQSNKTELVIFLRPQVIRNPGLEGDFRQFKTYLQKNTGSQGKRAGS